jgi:hypothetical protein
MSEVIVYTRPDGGVSVVYPAEGASLESLLQRSIPEDAINVRVASIDDLPKDREYRDAWTDANPGPQVDVDLDVAKEVHMTRIRAARNAELKKLDGLQMRHIAQPAKLAEIEKDKQALRDLPATFELTADNVDALKALWPKDLSRG